MPENHNDRDSHAVNAVIDEEAASIAAFYAATAMVINSVNERLILTLGAVKKAEADS